VGVVKLLLPALQLLIQNPGSRAAFSAENVSEKLPMKWKVCVYRVIQEALNNRAAPRTREECARGADRSSDATRVKSRTMQRFDAKPPGMAFWEWRSAEAACGTINIDSRVRDNHHGRTAPRREAAPETHEENQILLADDHTRCARGFAFSSSNSSRISCRGRSEDGRQAVALSLRKPDVAFSISDAESQWDRSSKADHRRESGRAVSF